MSTAMTPPPARTVELMGIGLRVAFGGASVEFMNGKAVAVGTAVGAIIGVGKGRGVKVGQGFAGSDIVMFRPVR